MARDSSNSSPRRVIKKASRSVAVKYNKEQRKLKVHKFLEKKKRRHEPKPNPYIRRKIFACSRPRVQGRFVKSKGWEKDAYKRAMKHLETQENSNPQNSSQNPILLLPKKTSPKLKSLLPLSNKTLSFPLNLRTPQFQHHQTANSPQKQLPCEILVNIHPPTSPPPSTPQLDQEMHPTPPPSPPPPFHQPQTTPSNSPTTRTSSPPITQSSSSRLPAVLKLGSSIPYTFRIPLTPSPRTEKPSLSRSMRQRYYANLSSSSSSSHVLIKPRRACEDQKRAMTTDVGKQRSRLAVLRKRGMEIDRSKRGSLSSSPSDSLFIHPSCHSAFTWARS